MAGILKRFKDIMAANINALLDKAEDPEIMIDQYLRDMESDLGKVKAETASIMADAEKAGYARSVRELADESSVLKAQVRELIKIINEYIYPTAAMMLLKKRIPSLVPDAAVDLDAVMRLLADQGRAGPDDVPDAASPDDAFLALAAGKEDGHVF